MTCCSIYWRRVRVILVGGSVSGLHAVQGYSYLTPRQRWWQWRRWNTGSTCDARLAGRPHQTYCTYTHTYIIHGSHVCGRRLEVNIPSENRPLWASKSWWSTRVGSGDGASNSLHASGGGGRTAARENASCVCTCIWWVCEYCWSLQRSFTATTGLYLFKSDRRLWLDTYRPTVGYRLSIEAQSTLCSLLKQRSLWFWSYFAAHAQ